MNRHDIIRLKTQEKRVYGLMQDSRWRTLSGISIETGDPEASVSARLRDLRKAGHEVNRQRKNEKSGTWWYQLVPKGLNDSTS